MPFSCLSHNEDSYIVYHLLYLHFVSANRLEEVKKKVKKDEKRKGAPVMKMRKDLVVGVWTLTPSILLFAAPSEAILHDTCWKAMAVSAKS